MKLIELKNYNINEEINKYKAIIDLNLEKFLEIRYPEEIWESMRYTVLSEGKRIRPILTLEVNKACGGKIENAIPTSCAIEMLHAQSLIHDDLPCMDNDDYRRGKLTNHKVFRESTAVLAGDALLSYAPQVIIQHTPDEIDKKKLLKVLEEFAIASGPLGIVGGQIVDIDSENKEIEIPVFNYIHTHKTGSLFKFSVRAGALLGGANEIQLTAFTEYAKLIGFAFQVADDVLDVIETKEKLGKTPGKDQKSNKNTHVSIFGLDESIEEVKRLCAQAQYVLKENNIDTPLLIGIAGSIALKVIK